MPLYIVRIEHEFMLVADDEQDAFSAARFHMDDVLASEGAHPDIRLANGDFAEGYDRECIPWNATDDRTVGDHMGDAIPEPVEDTP